MATAYSGFDTTPANVVADIKTHILNSTDWSNPAGSRVVATTTAGADMVVDLADAAATAAYMTLGIYRTAALADKVTRYINWRASGGATSDTLHVICSAGKDHLFFSIEGPRGGETNAVDATYGSRKMSFFLGAISAYFSADTIAAVCLVAMTANNAGNADTCWVSRNQANTASWVPARLATLTPPVVGITSGNNTPNIAAVQRVASSGNTYLFPYVVFEDDAGIRGRLTKLHFAGGSIDGNSNSVNDPVPNQGSLLTYSSDTYILLASNKASNTVVSGGICQPYGQANNDSAPANVWVSPVVAVPYS
jgi:hypothetical protein